MGRKGLIIILAIVAVAAISGLVTVMSSGSDIPQPSSQLPVAGAPDG